MDKEEAIKQFKNYFPDGVEAIVLSKEDYERQLGQLQFENIILKEIIHKAIAYMEKNMIDREINCYRIDQIDVRKLLDILKGGNNE